MKIEVDKKGYSINMGGDKDNKSIELPYCFISKENVLDIQILKDKYQKMKSEIMKSI